MKVKGIGETIHRSILLNVVKTTGEVMFIQVHYLLLLKCLRLMHLRLLLGGVTIITLILQELRCIWLWLERPILSTSKKTTCTWELKKTTLSVSVLPEEYHQYEFMFVSQRFSQNRFILPSVSLCWFQVCNKKRLSETASTAGSSWIRLPGLVNCIWSSWTLRTTHTFLSKKHHVCSPRNHQNASPIIFHGIG